jgi:hypothetical protein
MIPKVIHYCWFGYNRKSKLIKHCISSWRKYFPDFEIKEWNESNTDLDENEYIRLAYKAKKWAFVSDYVRMKVLYEYGGLYFDTDVEVIRKFPEDLFYKKAFAGIEGFSKMVAPGLVFGCESGLPIFKAVLDSYKKDDFAFTSIEKMMTINMRVTEILERDGYVKDDKYQEIDEISIFPSEIFNAYDGVNRIKQITDKTLSFHHYAGSWLPWYRRLRMRIGTTVRHIKYSLRHG